MAVDLMMGFRSSSSTFSEENAVQEAASGLQSVEKFIKLLSQSQLLRKMPSSQTEPEMDCKAIADVAVYKFKRVISLLGKPGREMTGHARFRRSPVGVTQQVNVKPSPDVNLGDTRVYCPTPINQIPFVQRSDEKPPAAFSRMDSLPKTIRFSSYSPAVSRASSFNLSSLTGDTTNSKQQQPTTSSSTFQISNLSQTSSGGKPPLSSCSKRKCCSLENGASGKCSGGSSGRCHCSKRRKMRMKRVIGVKAISMKLADIPPDDYWWKKYGQKAQVHCLLIPRDSLLKKKRGVVGGNGDDEMVVEGRGDWEGD